MRKTRKTKKVVGVCLGLLGLVAVWPGFAEATTFGQLAGATFGLGGPGAAIIQLLLICIVVWFAMYMATALNNGQVAALIKITGTFTCLGIIIGLAWGLLKSICAFAGITF